MFELQIHSNLILQQSYNDLFNVEENNLTVRIATDNIKQCLLHSSSLPSYVQSYIQYIISSAEMEQKIFDLSKIIKEVFIHEKVTGIPGQLHCTSNSIDNITTVLRKLENDSTN